VEVDVGGTLGAVGIEGGKQLGESSAHRESRRIRQTPWLRPSRRSPKCRRHRPDSGRCRAGLGSPPTRSGARRWFRWRAHAVRRLSRAPFRERQGAGSGGGPRRQETGGPLGTVRYRSGRRLSRTFSGRRTRRTIAGARQGYAVATVRRPNAVEPRWTGPASARRAPPPDLRLTRAGAYIEYPVDPVPFLINPAQRSRRNPEGRSATSAVLGRSCRGTAAVPGRAGDTDKRSAFVGCIPCTVRPRQVVFSKWFQRRRAR
jgi:hypothetical protein